MTNPNIGKHTAEAIATTQTKATGKGTDQRLANAHSVMLWLYRRLPRGYGEAPFVDRAIKDLAQIAGIPDERG